MGPASQSGGAHTRVLPSGVAGVWSGFFGCTGGVSRVGWLCLLSGTFRVWMRDEQVCRRRPGGPFGRRRFYSSGSRLGCIRVRWRRSGIRTG